MLTDEMRYKILRLLEQDPHLSQRDLAATLGISLGKTNYCLKALIRKGLIKAKNFQNSQNKMAYMYLLTTKGIEEKAKVTLRFLKQKMAEHEILSQEIEQIRQELMEKNSVSDKATETNTVN